MLRRPLAALAALALLVALPAAPRAQGETPSPAAEAPARAAERAAPARAADRRVGDSRVSDSPAELPRPATTRHRLKLAQGELAFTATVGATRLYDDGGTALADIVMTSYRVEEADPARRPVTFVVNGGPGASSAWLQFGAVGPWRLAIDGAAPPPSAAPVLLDNAETWLAFTDLVFVDPIGTGYSRAVATGDDARRRFYSIEGDVEILGAIMRRWIEDNRRELSPKVFLGESYGGFRGPLVARNLMVDHGVGLKGLVLVSPVLDFRLRDGRNAVAEAARLPSMVAAARRLRPELGGADLAEVERYAMGDYLADLLRGPRDGAARARMTAAVARLTGLDPDLIGRSGGRPSSETFLNNVDRQRGRVGSPYDAAALGLDPNPYGHAAQALDPVLDALRAPLTAAARELYAARLDWAPKRRYEILSSSVNRAWDWGRGLNPPQAADALAAVLAADPSLKVLVAHGAADLVTPYMASKLVMDQIAVPELGDRLQLAVYPGGHMFYFDAASRAAFRDAGRALVGAGPD